MHIENKYLLNQLSRPTQANLTTTTIDASRNLWPCMCPPPERLSARLDRSSCANDTVGDTDRTRSSDYSDGTNRGIHGTTTRPSGDHVRTGRGRLAATVNRSYQPPHK
jgi:hypothetical protein